MAERDDLISWLVEALLAHGGSATIVQLCKFVWDKHEKDLRQSGDLFYTWQYDIRWAATKLRQQGQIKDGSLSPRGVWELNRPLA